MPPVNGVGEPWAGEPHARFDAAGAGNGAPGHGHRSEAARRGNPGKSGCGTSRRTNATAPAPDPTRYIRPRRMGKDLGTGVQSNATQASYPVHRSIKTGEVRGPRKPDATALSADLAVCRLQTIPVGLRLRSSATIHVTHSFVQITGERRRTEPELLA
jgi:hypothetical protein